jgi:hypothetical protein
MNSNVPGATPVPAAAGPPSRTAWSLLDNYTVQQAAALTGLSEHTLRYYEKIGLIQPVPRQQSSGHRRYRASDMIKLETLACLRAAGPDPSFMARLDAAEPGGVAPVHRAHVEVVADADHPDCHRVAQGAVGSPRGDAQFVRRPDLGEFVAGPGSHRCISFGIGVRFSLGA